MTTDPDDLGAEIAAIFDRAARHHDKGLPFFRDFAADLVAWHGPPPGGRVLDLCTGSGACLQALAKVADTGCLVGLDLSRQMLLRALESLPGRIPLIQADTHKLPFTAGSFDAYYCALSWQLLPDPELMLAELRRVSRGEAGLTLSLLGTSRHTGHFMNKILMDYLGRTQPRFASILRALGRRPARETLQACGWHVLAQDEVTRRFEFQGPSQWLSWQSSQVGRGFFDLIPEEKQPEFYGRLLDEAERVQAADGLWLEQTAIMLHAKPT
jgi:ubiquinone/menaquinone biosynthesis C-methylase UbiE